MCIATTGQSVGSVWRRLGIPHRIMNVLHVKLTWEHNHTIMFCKMYTLYASTVSLRYVYLDRCDYKLQSIADKVAVLLQNQSKNESSEEADDSHDNAEHNNKYRSTKRRRTIL